MNPCVKTGFVFYDYRTGTKWTGDLFRISDGLYQIRGIPATPLDPKTPADAIVSNIVLCHRADGSYMDSNIGIKVFGLSQSFLNHLGEWYPELITNELGSL